MKLNATIKNERGGKKNTSDNIRIMTEFNYKNKTIGTVGLYAVNDQGYRLVYTPHNKGFGDEIMLAEVEKGEKQKGTNAK